MSSRLDRAVTLMAIDDDPQNLELIETALQQDGLDILTSTDPEQGLEIVLRRRPQIVILDLMMPKLGGIELLDRIIEADPGIEVVLLTGHYTSESAVAAIQKGASDYLEKTDFVPKLQQRVRRLVEEAQRRQRASRLDSELAQAWQFEGLVSRSPLMLDVFARIRRVAPHYRIALVTGDTGTGKELVARALQQLSPVNSGPFAVCNCSAIVETLFESELFGHVKGAFTGAVQDKVGLFEYANGGTVFLDEIGDMPLASQAKLLRVLQNQEVQRVGSPAMRKVDVHVVAATNRDLRTLVEEKKFREDLYYRLAMVEIQLPPLADKKEDLPLLVRHFLERFAAQYKKPVPHLTQRAEALLARYTWPGNIRELENALGHACMLAEEEAIDINDFPESLRRGVTRPPADEALLTLDELERRHVQRVLERVRGNKTHAIEILGIGRTTLYRILDRIEVGKKDEPREADAVETS